jgi:ribosomal protein L39E
MEFSKRQNRQIPLWVFLGEFWGLFVLHSIVSGFSIVSWMKHLFIYDSNRISVVLVSKSFKKNWNLINVVKFYICIGSLQMFRSPTCQICFTRSVEKNFRVKRKIVKPIFDNRGWVFLAMKEKIVSKVLKPYKCFD